jgi:hypothetical protein
MSKQQTFAPDDLETHRQKRSVKKAKPWVLWYRLDASPHRFRNMWSRFGKYASYLIAKDAMDRDARKWPRPISFEYRIMHEDEGKPK